MASIASLCGWPGRSWLVIQNLSVLGKISSNFINSGNLASWSWSICFIKPRHLTSLCQVLQLHEANCSRMLDFKKPDHLAPEAKHYGVFGFMKLGAQIHKAEWPSFMKPVIQLQLSEAAWRNWNWLVIPSNNRRFCEIHDLDASIEFIKKYPKMTTEVFSYTSRSFHITKTLS